MTILRQFGFEGRDFAEDAASFCNYAGQMRYKHPWCAKSHAATILLLPSFERVFFCLDPFPPSHDAMSQLAMQTLARGSQFALRFGVLPLGRLIALTLFPAQALLATFFD